MNWRGEHIQDTCKFGLNIIHRPVDIGAGWLGWSYLSKQDVVRQFLVWLTALVCSQLLKEGEHYVPCNYALVFVIP